MKLKVKLETHKVKQETQSKTRKLYVGTHTVGHSKNRLGVEKFKMTVGLVL